MVRAIRKFHKRLSAPCSENGGGVAVITALVLPVLVGLIGLGLDTANWYTNHRQMDRIVETAAAAAAPYLTSDTTAQITAIAENVAALNGLSTSSGDTITVTVATNPSTLTVTGTRKLKRFFSALFLRTTPVTTSTATAGSSSNPVCMLSQTLQVNSGAQLAAPNCEIDVASPAAGATVINSSSIQVAKLCVAGTATGSTISNLANNCTTATDPYAGSLPTPTIPTCTVNGANYGPGIVTLNPGRYCGHFNWNGPGTLNLNPGLYILNDDWTLSETWTVNGTGVTFYLADSNSYIDFNGQSTVTLTPPSSGPYANILMFEPPGLVSSTSGCTGDGCFNLTAQTSGNALQGLIYLPSRNIYLQSPNFVSGGLTIVANQVTFYSTMSWTISPGANAIPSAGGGTGTLTN